MLGAGAWMGGCGEKKMIVTQYPEFYTEDLQTVAVVPFRSMARDPQAGERVSEIFARSLQRNNTYKVFAQNDLQAMLTQQDLEIFAGTGDAASAAARFKPGGQIQALMVGTVTMYDVTRDDQRHQEPVYSTDRNGRRYQSSTRTYTVTRIEATVSVSAALIRVSDGTQLHATSMETGKAIEEGERIQRNETECLRVATQQAVSKLVEQFAVVNKELRVDKNAVRLARDGMGGVRNFTDKFSTTDASAQLVVDLPVSCDRNEFRWLICRDKGQTELDADTFVWTREAARSGGMMWDICPAQLAQDGGGPGSVTVQLINGREVVLTKKFKIDAPKGQDTSASRRYERPSRDGDRGGRSGGRGGDGGPARNSRVPVIDGNPAGND